MRRLVTILLLCLASLFIMSIFVALSSSPFATVPNCDHTGSQIKSENDKPKFIDDNLDMVESAWGEHKIAIIVPFRNRFEELLQFVPHMHQFLNQQKVNHKIYIVNQIDQHRFNRASLINVGHLLSRNECDYLAMHDVDLLPLNPNLPYSYPKHGPFHVAAPELHPKYHYSTFVGGILILTREDFELVNGLSNKYWGWGLEDDEFYARMKEAKLKISRPKNITTNQENTFKHVHDRYVRRRDTARLFNQKEATRRRDRVTGLNSVKYKIDSWHKISIDNGPVVIYNVKLECDYKLTPWCDH